MKIKHQNGEVQHVPSVIGKALIIAGLATEIKPPAGKSTLEIQREELAAHIAASAPKEREDTWSIFVRPSDTYMRPIIMRYTGFRGQKSGGTTQHFDCHPKLLPETVPADIRADYAAAFERWARRDPNAAALTVPKKAKPEDSPNFKQAEEMASRRRIAAERE